MKYTIVSKREYSFKDKTTGEDVSGFMYGCFDPENNGFEFSSQNGEYEPVTASKFDSEKAVDLKIRTRFFQGKVKYSEETPMSD